MCRPPLFLERLLTPSIPSSHHPSRAQGRRACEWVPASHRFPPSAPTPSTLLTSEGGVPSGGHWVPEALGSQHSWWPATPRGQRSWKHSKPQRGSRVWPEGEATGEGQPWKGQAMLRRGAGLWARRGQEAEGTQGLPEFGVREASWITTRCGHPMSSLPLSGKVPEPLRSWLVLTMEGDSDSVPAPRAGREHSKSPPESGAQSWRETWGSGGQWGAGLRRA